MSDYNSHGLFIWNKNNILWNDNTNKYTDIFLQTGTRDLENFEWQNSLCYKNIDNEYRLIQNSNHFIHHIDYKYAQYIYNQVVRNYYEFINESKETTNNTLDDSKTYFYMIDSFVFSNSGHNLSVLLDQIDYIINNNIKDILILEGSKNTNNFKLIELLIPDCLFYEVKFNTIYKIKNIIIIRPEFYNIFKHSYLIDKLRDIVYNTYKDKYNDCFNKNIILIKKIVVLLKLLYLLNVKN